MRRSAWAPPVPADDSTTHDRGALPHLAIIVGLAIPAVALAHRLRLPPLVALLLAGIVIGPDGAGLIPDPADVSALSEIGVVLLLFAVGAVSNGLALCTEDHRALDRGAIGLEVRGELGYILLVSREVTGQSEAFHRLVDASGEPVRPAQPGRPQPGRPQPGCPQPDPAFVAWRQKEGFRGNPRPG